MYSLYRDDVDDYLPIQFRSFVDDDALDFRLIWDCDVDFLKAMGYENVVSCRSVVQTGTTYLADPFWLLEEDSLSSLPECSHGLLLVAGMDCAACLVGLVAGRLWC